MGHRRSLTAFHCVGCLLPWRRARCSCGGTRFEGFVPDGSNEIGAMARRGGSRTGLVRCGSRPFAAAGASGAAPGFGRSTPGFTGNALDTRSQRRFQAAGARAQFAAARYQYEETKVTLTQQIRDAYWSLAAARAQTQIAQEGLQDSQRVYQLTQTQFQAGASPRVD